METLHSKKLVKGSQGASAQQYVDVAEIKDGVVVLNNGGLRSIVLVSSINFDLKSTEEQDAIIHHYQNFLNSLEFPLQIIIRSRKLNIEPYLEFLKKSATQHTNELLRFQVVEYENFIRNLTEVSNIMTKSFYLVVPFSPQQSTEEGFFGKVGSMFHAREKVVASREAFETYKHQLWQRVDHVIVGLSGSGVKMVTLKTDEIIELLYNSYNPSLYTNTLIKELEGVELERDIKF